MSSPMSSPMKPSIDQVHRMLGQSSVGARRPAAYRPVRLVFGTPGGVRAFDVPHRGVVGFIRDIGRFHVVTPGGGVEQYFFDELIDASFIDELDTSGDARAVG